MKLLTLKFLLVFIYLISSSPTYSIEHPNIKNLVFHKETKKIANIKFKNSNNETINLIDHSNRLIIINFWATWCAPCREEMPSLSKLKNNKKFNNLTIFAINVGQEDLSRSQDFFKKLDINNLEIYFDPKINLANIFGLRGLPTTILINKNNEEFARILGAIDFQDENLINWLKKFD